jgi:hypothetical protein
VEISAALAADLEILTDALDEPGIDLEALLRAFAVGTSAAVDSYLGLMMTLVIDGESFTLTTMDPVAVGTSLRLPLNVLCDVELGSVLVLYASRPGAFVDLAADIGFTLGLAPDVVTLDHDLSPTSDLAGLSGLSEMSDVNQAIGILIEQGHLPDSARDELHHMAARTQTTLHAAAEKLIRAAVLPPVPGEAGRVIRR